MTKTMKEQLGLGEKPMPLPRKYVPKLRVRITDDRTKRITEFTSDLPVDGYVQDMFPVVKQLRRVLEIHGLMPAEAQVLAPVAEEEAIRAP